MASVMVGSPASAHSKLHKRHPSDTPIFAGKGSKAPNPTVKRLSLDHKRMVGYNDARDGDGLSQPPVSPSSLKIRSPIKRTSTKEGLVDLSRSITENESLTGIGLGLHDSDLGDYGSGFSSGPRSVTDVPFVPVRGTRHIRSTSKTSNYSGRNSGSFQRPNAPYAHPMRQTPRPYTPPISRSITMSTGGHSSEEDPAATSGALLLNADDPSPSKDMVSNAADDISGVPGSTTSFPAIASQSPVPAQTLPSESTARFSIASQTSLPAAGRRSRGATMQSVDTTSASSRPSMEKAINFLRTQRSNTTGSDIDTPASAAERAANIRAARAAYQEREEAKERKVEKEEMRQAERERRRQHRKDGRRSRKGSRAGSTSLRPGSGTGTTDEENSVVPEDDEKAGEVGGSEYASLRPNSRNAPTRVEKLGPRPQSMDDTTRERVARRKKRNAKSRWALFIAWLRTRLLRMGS